MIFTALHWVAGLVGPRTEALIATIGGGTAIGVAAATAIPALPPTIGGPLGTLLSLLTLIAYEEWRERKSKRQARDKAARSTDRN